MLARILFSNKFLYIMAVCVILFAVLAAAFGLLTDHETPSVCFDILFKLLLSCFLFRSCRKYNLLAIQACCCGLLITVLYTQQASVLGDLLVSDVQSYINMGFWGTFYLACELMLFILYVILVANHLLIFVLNRISFLRVIVNQATILIVFAFQVLSMFVIAKLTSGHLLLLYYLSYRLMVSAILFTVAHAETVLAIDAMGQR